MKQSRVFFWSIWFIATLLLPVKAADKIYYDIDFSSPLHTVGHAPTTGNSIHTPREIVFGNPTVTESFGNLQNQPLVFDSLGNDPQFYYDQIELTMDKGAGLYYTSFDVVTQNLIGSANQFVVLFDLPAVHNITFQSDGMLDLFWAKQTTFQDNQMMHFEVIMNLSQEMARIILNGTEIYNDGLRETSLKMWSIRFSHGLKSQPGNTPADTSSSVGIDNILVANYIIPEPATLSLVAIGGLALLRKRK